MPLLEDIARIVTHPLIQAGAVTLLRYTAAQNAAARAEAYRQQAYETLKGLIASAPTTATPIGTPATVNPTGIPATANSVGTPATATPLLTDPISEELARASALLDEAARFAVRDPKSPEIAPRVERAAEHLLKAERFYMTPGEIAKLPPQKQQLAKKIAPAIAAVRQKLMNQPGSVENGAAEVAKVLEGWAKGTVPAIALPIPEALPEMNPATGCIPCARSHLAQVAAELEEAARDPARRNAWVTDAVKQLLALEEVDWSPEKLAASAPEVREVVERYRPEVQALRQELMAGRFDAGIAARARDLQRRFAADADRIKTDLDRAFERAVAAVGR